MPVTIDGNLGILSPDFEPNGSTVPTNGLYLPTTNAVSIATNSTERLRLDSSGNLGLGVTPSAWGSSSVVIQTAAGTIESFNGVALNVVQNAYRNSGNNWVYNTTAAATAYTQNVGKHYWSTAASGTAGTTISFTPAMTLDANGNLVVGSTSVDSVGSTTTITIDKPSGNGQLSLAANGTVRGRIFADNSTSEFRIGNPTSNPLMFFTANLERARIDSSGNLLVGTTTSAGFGSANRIYKNVAQGGFVLAVDAGSEYASLFQAVSGGGYNTNAAAQWIGKNTGNNRSINAGGTVNANGADYAEYMTKAGDFEIAKGDVCGIDANGLLTNVFADAVSFVVKSTNPSYVGNDSWGAGIEDQDALEVERQKVDRIAFAGQVPVNVLGASPGEFIIPIEEAGVIKGEAVANPTLEQYVKAVGKVIAIESDGRARIIVKVA